MTPDSRPSAKLPEIEILRALSILIVLFGHLPFHMPNILIHGYTGVTLFFVISGFVVAKSFARDLPLNASAGAHVAAFYTRRAFRILPTATIWIALYYAIGLALRAAGGSYGTDDRWAREVGWYFSGVYNYLFAYSHGPALFGQYWSLFVEMHFYFLMPAIFIVARQRRHRAMICIAGFVLVACVLRPLTDPGLAGLLSHTQMDALIAGVLLFLMAAAPGQPLLARLPSWQRQLLQSAVSLALFAALWFLPASMDVTSTPTVKYPVFVALAVGLVYLAQRGEGWVGTRVAAVDRALVYLGSRSFSLYICHVVIFSGVFPVFAKAFPWASPTGSLSTAVVAAALFAVALVTSDISYRLIEAPFIALGKRLMSAVAATRDPKPNVFETSDRSAAIEA